MSVPFLELWTKMG